MKKSIAIVTGASQGIGRATAIRLGKDFSGLMLVARDKEALTKTAEAATAAGAKAEILDLDLRDRAAPEVKGI
jgi:3-oxoacyl-[acyl-carrier protein] reductase